MASQQPLASLHRSAVLFRSVRCFFSGLSHFHTHSIWDGPRKPKAQATSRAVIRSSWLTDSRFTTFFFPLVLVQFLSNSSPLAVVPQPFYLPPVSTGHTPRSRFVRQYHTFAPFVPYFSIHPILQPFSPPATSTSTQSNNAIHHIRLIQSGGETNAKMSQY
ncbi:hypothetical protein F4815DRAFT_127433 [Daldinia loculata]|nr:hypothetical protein F4815DRAFT_127433 [Daldinia loculata]